MEHRRITRSFQKKKDAAAAATTRSAAATTRSAAAPKPSADLSVAMFPYDPIGDALVTNIKGVTIALGRKMAKKDYDKAYRLLGKYLVLKRDTELFIFWLKCKFGATDKQARLIHDELYSWCEEFL